MRKRAHRGPCSTERTQNKNPAQYPSTRVQMVEDDHPFLPILRICFKSQAGGYRRLKLRPMQRVLTRVTIGCEMCSTNDGMALLQYRL